MTCTLLIALLAISIFPLAPVHDSDTRVDTTCPPADSVADARTRYFFTWEYWESERVARGIDPVDPRELTRVATPALCSWISSNIEKSEDRWNRAYYRLPDGRFVVYKYRDYKPLEIDPVTGDISIETGYDTLTIYSSSMTMIVGYLI